MSRPRHLRKRAGRNPGAEQLAEHQRVEALFADGEGWRQPDWGARLPSPSPLTSGDEQVAKAEQEEAAVVARIFKRVRP